MTRERSRIGNALWLAVVLLGAFWLGTAVPPPVAGTAEVQQPESKEQFLAGDERSIPVLKEIAATAKQIDGRLERIEKLLAERRQP